MKLTVDLDSYTPRGGVIEVRYFGWMAPEGTKAFKVHPADWLSVAPEDKARFEVFDVDEWRNSFPIHQRFWIDPTCYSFVEEALLNPLPFRLRNLRPWNEPEQRLADTLPTQSQNPPAECLDCGLPYEEFPIDVTLPDDQWELIHPDRDGLLCARCIVSRGSKLNGVVAARMRFEIQ